MSRVALVRGQFVANRLASVSMEDRGYQFADGIYEVVAYYHKQMLDRDLHVDRLERSLEKLNIPMPMTRRALELKIDQLIAQNTREHGLVYIQITRGAAARNHVYTANMKPVLTMSCLAAPLPNAPYYTTGVNVIFAEDIRWNRCDIKTIALLPNSMKRMEAQRAGAREAWLVRDGVVTEGSATNAYIVDERGVLRTHPADDHILSGITRAVVLRLAKERNLPVEERAFTEAECKTAREAFITSASSHILPVTSIEGAPVGEGTCGAITTQLMQAYRAHVIAQIGRDI